MYVCNVFLWQSFGGWKPTGVLAYCRFARTRRFHGSLLTRTGKVRVTDNDKWGCRGQVPGITQRSFGACAAQAQKTDFLGMVLSKKCTLGISSQQAPTRQLESLSHAAEDSQNLRVNVSHTITKLQANDPRPIWPATACLQLQQRQLLLSTKWNTPAHPCPALAVSCDC